MAIGALVTLVPQPGREANVVERLRDVAGDVRQEPGNLLTVILKDRDSAGSILLFEIYGDEAAIEAHRSAPHTMEKGPAVHAMLARPIEVRWLDVIDMPALDAAPSA